MDFDKASHWLTVLTNLGVIAGEEGLPAPDEGDTWPDE
jgi:hypothetical protein